MKRKNVILAIVQSEDPARYRDRTVLPEKGKGRKTRPRVKSWKNQDSGSSYFIM